MVSFREGNKVDYLPGNESNISLLKVAGMIMYSPFRWDMLILEEGK